MFGTKAEAEEERRKAEKEPSPKSQATADVTREKIESSTDAQGAQSEQLGQSRTGDSHEISPLVKDQNSHALPNSQLLHPLENTRGITGTSQPVVHADQRAMPSFESSAKITQHDATPETSVAGNGGDSAEPSPRKKKAAVKSTATISASLTWSCALSVPR